MDYHISFLYNREFINTLRNKVISPQHYSYAFCPMCIIECTQGFIEIVQREKQYR
jgi:hypothetical protein